MPSQTGKRNSRHTTNATAYSERSTLAVFTVDSIDPN
jgi:hypothetical protein